MYDASGVRLHAGRQAEVSIVPAFYILLLYIDFHVSKTFYECVEWTWEYVIVLSICSSELQLLFSSRLLGILVALVEMLVTIS